MSSARRPARPSVDELFDVFAGRIFRPAVDGGVRILGVWGWGGSAPDISSLSLNYDVGRSREGIGITIAVGSPGPRSYARPLFSLLDAVALRDSPTFPLVIERSKQRIRVSGRERVFTSYTAAHAAVAVARMGDFRLSISCSRARLATLQLEPLDPDAFRKIMPL